MFSHLYPILHIDTNISISIVQRCQFVRFSRESYGFPLFWLAYVRTKQSLRIYYLKKKKLNFIFLFLLKSLFF